MAAAAAASSMKVSIPKTAAPVAKHASVFTIGEHKRDSYTLSESVRARYNDLIGSLARVLVSHLIGTKNATRLMSRKKGDPILTMDDADESSMARKKIDDGFGTLLEFFPPGARVDGNKYWAGATFDKDGNYTVLDSVAREADVVAGKSAMGVPMMMLVCGPLAPHGWDGTWDGREAFRANGVMPLIDRMMDLLRGVVFIDGETETPLFDLIHTFHSIDGVYVNRVIAIWDFTQWKAHQSKARKRATPAHRPRRDRPTHGGAGETSDAK